MFFSSAIQPALLAKFIACFDGDQFPLVNDADAVSHFFGDAELVCGEKNGHAFFVTAVSKCL